MKYTEAQQGRIFILRLEQGDLLPDTIEAFARNKEINAAMVHLFGGADKGSTVIAAPTDDSSPEKPLTLHRNYLTNVHETLGIGTVFPDESEQPILHLHAAFGRGRHTLTGCIREGVPVWMYMEVVLVELVGCTARRKIDAKTGFVLLEMC